ncbi:MAG: hypothetical protein JWQ09_5614, partial [Segetibacter sp.]|nr:hypothetical protein [Segetibacter sp.]
FDGPLLAIGVLGTQARRSFGVDFHNTEGLLHELQIFSLVVIILLLPVVLHVDYLPV